LSLNPVHSIHVQVYGVSIVPFYGVYSVWA
jgi:hypothetical protein